MLYIGLFRYTLSLPGVMGDWMMKSLTVKMMPVNYFLLYLPDLDKPFVCLSLVSYHKYCSKYGAEVIIKILIYCGSPQLPRDQ